jgi:hypothetical protein
MDSVLQHFRIALRGRPERTKRWIAKRGGIDCCNPRPYSYHSILTLFIVKSVAALIKSETDKEYLSKIMQTLTSRIVPTMSDNDKVNLNLNEYVFFRRAAIAWQ